MEKTETTIELSDFEFKFNENDDYQTIRIDSYSRRSEQVIIPASVGGIPVTAIGEYAFFNHPRITNVIIPEGIRSIDDNAFSCCTSLTEISLPEGLISIGDYAFRDCTALTSVSLPESLVSIGSCAFEGCKKIASITLPKGFTEIRGDAFDGCDNLTEIIVDKENPAYTLDEGVLFDKNKTTLVWYPRRRKGDYVVPNTVIALGDNAFDGCNELTRITFPQDTDFISYHMFSSCKQLTDIMVNENSMFFRSIDGVLFDNEKKELLFYPKGKEKTDYIVPEGIYLIGYKAFNGCENLAIITLPESLKVIENQAFSGCKRLVSIILPKNLKCIVGKAFEDCPLLETVKLSRKTKILDKTFEGFSGQLVYID